MLFNFYDFLFSSMSSLNLSVSLFEEHFGNIIAFEIYSNDKREYLLKR